MPACCCKGRRSGQDCHQPWQDCCEHWLMTATSSNHDSMPDNVLTASGTACRQPDSQNAKPQQHSMQNRLNPDTDVMLRVECMSSMSLKVASARACFCMLGNVLCMPMRAIKTFIAVQSSIICLQALLQISLQPAGCLTLVSICTLVVARVFAMHVQCLMCVARLVPTHRLIALTSLVFGDMLMPLWVCGGAGSCTSGRHSPLLDCGTLDRICCVGVSAQACAPTQPS